MYVSFGRRIATKLVYRVGFGRRTAKKLVFGCGKRITKIVCIPHR